jgi:hypothetical protein
MNLDTSILNADDFEKLARNATICHEAAEKMFPKMFPACLLPGKGTLELHDDIVDSPYLVNYHAL